MHHHTYIVGYSLDILNKILGLHHLQLPASCLPRVSIPKALPIYYFSPARLFFQVTGT